MPDYHKIDYRGFAFVIHNTHGMLLLHCTRKPKKGPHFQLPGGHIDAYEFQYAAEKCGTGASTREVLLEAAKMGTARELFEETGMDLRGQLDRFDPTPLWTGSDSDSQLNCMMEHKCYFTVNVTDDDFPIGNGEGFMHPNDENGHYLTVSGVRNVSILALAEGDALDFQIWTFSFRTFSLIFFPTAENIA